MKATRTAPVDKLVVVIDDDPLEGNEASRCADL
jgi:hypothetical protein